MKTLSYKHFLVVAIAILFVLAPSNLAAQSSVKQHFANGDWQFNAPLDNNFTEKASGWGMNFEGGYFVSKHFGFGLFISFCSNHKYIPTETINIGSDAAITTNQQRSLFQLPFGLAFRYRFSALAPFFDPYLSLKVGPEYSQLSSFVSTYQIYNRKWGFFFSPEVGSNFWINSQKSVGLHIAAYYSFASNKSAVLNGDIDKINNIGFRLGLAF